MLHHLVKYAESKGLAPEPGFKQTTVRWALSFGAGGRFLRAIPLGAAAPGKRSPGKNFPRCPYVHLTSSGATRSQFLADSARVVALLGQEPGDPKAHRKHSYFVELLREAAQDIPRLAPVASAMGTKSTVDAIRSDLERSGAGPGDTVTFEVEGTCPVEWAECLDWWRRRRETLAPEKAQSGIRKRPQRPCRQMRCLATGELVEPARIHEVNIRGLEDIGGRRGGSALVSFNDRAFCSYGLDQSYNGPMSEKAAAAYCAALNDILQESGHRLAASKIACWFKGKVPPEQDPIALLFRAQVDEVQELSALERARQLVQSLETGKIPDLHENWFYALTLSAAEGRIMVRDWTEGQFEQLARNVCAWFDDLHIVAYRGSETAPYPGMERLITSVLESRRPGQRYEDWVRPIGPERVLLWRAGVRGETIPHGVLGRLVVVHRPFIQRAELEEAEKSPDPRRKAAATAVLHARMMLMKAYHIRKHRKGGGENMSHDLKPYLNEEHRAPAYQCGRLMAVLAGLQRAALGGVGAGVVQRYYAAASATPALVFGRLVRTAQFHLNKLDPGLAHWYEDKIAGITQRLKDNIPRTLDLEEQSLFALGYYQQLADMRTRKSDSSIEEKEESHE